MSSQAFLTLLVSSPLPRMRCMRDALLACAAAVAVVVVTVAVFPSKCTHLSTSTLTEREDQVPAHAPAAARAQEEVQDYLQGRASHDLLGLDYL